MDDTHKKAMLVNAVLVAEADGVIAPLEQGLIRQLLMLAGITDEQARRWWDEHKAGGGGFLPVHDEAAALDVLRLTIGVVAADRELAPGEWIALLHLAKALGISNDVLRELVQTCWNQDVLARLAARHEPEAAPTGPPVLLVTDHFDRLEPFLAASPGVPFDQRPLGGIPAQGGQAHFAVFHAAEDKEDSVRILTALQAALPSARLMAVVGRHQGYQVSYLLEAGLFRCLVEEVYPDELAELMRSAE